jgi:hypothetical protein
MCPFYYFSLRTDHMDTCHTRHHGDILSSLVNRFNVHRFVMIDSCSLLSPEFDNKEEASSI